MNVRRIPVKTEEHAPSVLNPMSALVPKDTLVHCVKVWFLTFYSCTKLQLSLTCLLYMQMSNVHHYAPPHSVLLQKLGRHCVQCKWEYGQLQGTRPGWVYYRCFKLASLIYCVCSYACVWVKNHLC